MFELTDFLGFFPFYVLKYVWWMKSKKCMNYSVIFLVVLSGSRTQSLTLKEEHSLRMFKNGLLRKIIGPKRDRVTRSWRKLHSDRVMVYTLITR